MFAPEPGISVPTLKLVIDGTSAGGLGGFRVQSPLHASTLPGPTAADNQLGIPPGTSGFSISDEYWIMMNSLREPMFCTSRRQSRQVRAQALHKIQRIRLLWEPQRQVPSIVATSLPDGSVHFVFADADSHWWYAAVSLANNRRQAAFRFRTEFEYRSDYWNPDEHRGKESAPHVPGDGLEFSGPVSNSDPRLGYYALTGVAEVVRSG